MVEAHDRGRLGADRLQFTVNETERKEFEVQQRSCSRKLKVNINVLSVYFSQLETCDVMLPPAASQRFTQQIVLILLILLISGVWACFRLVV